MENLHRTISSHSGLPETGKAAWRYARLIVGFALCLCLPNVYAQESPVNERIAAAVLDVVPQSVAAGEAALVTELLKDELLRTNIYTIVEKQQLDAVIAEQSFQHFGLTEAERAVELGKILTVNIIFIGTLGKIQNVRILAVRMVDIETGEIVKSAIERDFSARDASLAVRRVVQKLHGFALDEASIVIQTAERSDVGRYVMLYSGWSLGSLINYDVESVFKSGPVAGEPIWSGLAAEVKAKPRFPGVGLRLGAWKKWFGGDVEISALSYSSTAQSIHYDIAGYVRLNNEWYEVFLDTLVIPDNFQQMLALGFGGNFYIHIPSKIVQPYMGIGASMLMNRVTSDLPGPGNVAMGLEGVPLNSTSLGWAVQFPMGIKYPLSNQRFVYIEFRPARHLFSFVSGDGFQRERDRFTLQSFQLLLGYGLIFR